MNVSFLNTKKFEIQEKVKELKVKGKVVIDRIDETRLDFIEKWETRSKELVLSFLKLFGREGRLVKPLSTIWNEGKDMIRNSLSPTGSPGGSDQDDEVETEIPPPKRHHKGF